MKGKNLLKIIEEFRKLDSEIEGQVIGLFVSIAMCGDKGVTLKELGEKLGIEQSSVSRNVMKLCKVNRHRTKGLDLVETFENPEERRSKLARLTYKGKRVWNSITEI